MARCERCDGCRSMWDMKDCLYCGYPKADTRKAKDDSIIKKAQEDDANLIMTIITTIF